MCIILLFGSVDSDVIHVKLSLNGSDIKDNIQYHVIFDTYLTILNKLVTIKLRFYLWLSYRVRLDSLFFV